MGFFDARRMDAGEVIRADVCVVGAGAAGLAIAREFAGSDARVVLIESGDLAFRHSTQFLYIGECSGIAASPTVHSRFRQFGGSITRWAGQCRPLDAIDFEPRDGLPGSGWPFGLDHLEPFYRRAHELCDLGPYDYRPEAVATALAPMLPIDSAELATRVFRFSPPAWLVQSSRYSLAAARNVHVYLNANVVELKMHSSGQSIVGLAVVTLDGKRLTAVAGAYVLACGGIENARLLLASNQVVQRGIGNERDLVGRCFMDHPYFLLGYFEPADSRYDSTPYVIEDYAQAGSALRSHTAFALSEQVLRSERLNNGALFFVRRPAYKTRPEYFTAAGRSLQHLIDILRHRAAPDRSLGRQLCNVLLNAGDVAGLLSRQLAELVRPQPRLALRAVLEATPCPDSRVTLDSRRDRLGMPRVRVHWQLNPQDRRGLDRLMQALRSELSRLRVGRLVEDRSVDAAGWPSSMTAGKHHMGTTRMDSDPRKGVVDADCRVHSVDNRFVAGSSVFPTGGYANPTLTIIALGIRLADHLKARMSTR